MNAEQTELFRKAILRVLDANRTRFGLTPKAIGIFCRPLGFEPGEEEVAEGIEYLTRKGMVEEVLKTVSRENRCWRITGSGIAFLDSGE
jgi:hypothetical protein